MRMIAALIVIAGIAGAFSMEAPGKKTKKESIAILQFDTLNCPKYLGDLLTDHLASSFAEYGRYDVIEHNQLRKIIGQWELYQSGIYNDTKIVEVGNIAKSDVVMIGNISRIDSRYALNARTVNVSSQKIIFSKKIYAENEKDLYRVSDRLVEFFHARNSDVTKKCYIITIGIDKYRDKSLAQEYCKSDARAVRDIFFSRLSSRYSIVTRELYDGDAGGKDILGVLDGVARSVKLQDMVILYFAGYSHFDTNESYLIPSDVDTKRIKETSVPLSSISDSFQMMYTNRTIIILDSLGVKNKNIDQFVKKTGSYFISSVSEGELGYESKELGHGIFTYFLVEALKGKGGAGDKGKMTISRLISQVKKDVTAYSKQKLNAPMTPIAYYLDDDFEL